VGGSRRPAAKVKPQGFDCVDASFTSGSAAFCGATTRGSRPNQVNPSHRVAGDDHVLEIGTGWGGFAAFAAMNYGCRVTTTTIRQQQHDYAKQIFSNSGLDNRVNLLFEDYRNLRGKYDKIVSIEMFEAVGHGNYDDYFSVCDPLLKFNGAMLLQTITIRESRFDRYRRQNDWINKHICPGAEFASIRAIIFSLTRCPALYLFDLEDIGLQYAFTLRDWRRGFLQRLDEVRTAKVHSWSVTLAIYSWFSPG
jgi:cyclopropane-fatty-acyl-phospholipid synthase